jgi:hypothetical protein
MLSKQCEILRVADLQVDEAYQRLINEANARERAKNFVPEALNTLLVGRRADESCWIVDGLQRHAMLILLDISEAECYVFQSGGRTHEAAIFEVVNCHRRGVEALVRFHAIVIAGEKSAIELLAVAREFGFDIPRTRSRGWPRLSAITPLRNLQKASSTEGVRWVLETLHRAFDNRISSRDQSLSNDFLGALCAFRRKYADADQDRLVRVLNDLPVQEFLTENKPPTSGSRYGYLAACLALLYNRGLRNNRLETPFDNI